jgi:Ca2+-binding EF-hand superfamily protein
MEDEEELIYDLPRGSEAPSEDVTSETGSVCEEERVRKLFQACDADGDGYIDRYIMPYYLFLRDIKLSRKI